MVYKAELNTLINDCELYLLGVNVRECVRPCQPVSQMARPHHFFFSPSSPLLPLSTARGSVSDRRWWSGRRQAEMFITTNKPLHRRRPVDTGSPWEMLLLQACPRLAPRVPSRLADAGEPSGATLASSVKWAERFFPQAQSDVVKPCEGNFFFPIQSFDISAQGNGETCWGFTHSLPQTGCHYGNSTVDLSLNIFLEKCGLMHENPPNPPPNSLLCITRRRVMCE